MASISIPTAILVAGSAAAVGSVAAASIGSSAASKAARVQAQAAQQATQVQQSQFDQTVHNLAPFVQGGQQAFSALNDLTGVSVGGNPLTAPLTKPFAPVDLEATPGYKFILDQGLKATQNSYAGMGLGSSGAAMKGAADYATGLASSTYNTQLENYLKQNQQIYNMISGQAGTGEAAAAGQGQIGAQTAAGIGNTITSGAAATAGGIVGSANALSAGITGVANTGANTTLLSTLAPLLTSNGLYGNTNSKFGGGLNVGGAWSGAEG